MTALTAPTTPVAAPVAAPRSRWLALAVLCVGMLMIVLDGTVVNVALPAIRDDLGFSQSSLAWVANAYLIAFGGLLLLAGRLGDLFSRRRVFMTGLVVFTAASLGCGLARSQAVLVAARFVQGVGGALTSAVILGMIVTLFPERREQARAIGLYAFVASAGGSIGLLAGGVITELISWHWIFFINVPIGIAAVVVAPRLLAAEPVSRGSADVPGALLITSALMVGVYAIVASRMGFAAVAALLLVAFVVRQLRAAHPLVPLRIFRSRTVVGANLVQALTVAGMFGMFFLGVLYLQGVLGYDELHTGLAFLPTTLVIGALSMRYAEPLIIRFGARTALLPGLVLIAAGLALFARVPVHGSYVADVLPASVLLGTGVGVGFPALMSLAMADATASDAGLASGLVNTTAQVGAAVGLAVLASLSSSRTAALAASRPHLVALTDGYRLGFLVAAGLVVAAFVVAVVVLPRAKR